MVESAQYTDEARTSVRAVIDGAEKNVPVDEGNRHYRMIKAAVDAGDLTIDEPEAPTAAQVEAESLRAIDAKAGEVRDRFITSGIGQESTYLSKYEEAKAYKAASSPSDSDYPLLNAESTRRGLTMTELADEVIARRTSWIDPAAANVEAERVGGKQDVRAASTVADKESARDNAIAALDAITPS